MKSHRWTYKVATALLFLGVAYGFSTSQNASSKQPASNQKLPKLVQEALTKKMDNFHKTIIDKCIKDAIKDAELYVDSLVAEEFKILGADTLSFPRRPVRPSLPEKIILNDSTGIAPVVPKGEFNWQHR